MPNYTNNRIIVRGTDKCISRFMEDGKPDKHGKISFSSWLPMPQTFRNYDTTNHPFGKGLQIGKEVGVFDSRIVTEELIEEFKKASEFQKENFGVVGWYEWANANWGTKWDADMEIVSQDANRVEFECETAWDAPLEFIKFISEKYSEMEIVVYSHYEDNNNTALVFCDGEAYDIKQSIVEELLKRGNEFLPKEGEEDADGLRKKWDEFIGGEWYDISVVSAYVDGGRTELVEFAFRDWLEWAPN